jgi:hypothetical protein
MIVPVLSAASLAAISSAYADPVLNIVDRPVTSLKKMALDDVRRGIVLGGTRYQWIFSDDGPGKLKATQNAGKLSAVINISYTETAYSITLVESAGLGQKGDQIRARYNRWIGLLTRNIDSELTKMAVGVLRP